MRNELEWINYGEDYKVEISQLMLNSQIQTINDQK